MYNRLCLVFALLLLATLGQAYSARISADSVITIKKTSDFEVNGAGTAPQWKTADWFELTVQKGPRQPEPGKQFDTRVKILYSAKGIYFLYNCADQKLTATITEDFGALFTEDVVEVFLWPDTDVPIYLEYEVSPLNYELPILVPNIKGRAQGWKPWHYNDTNKVRHATSVQGGEKKSMSAITGWMAEFFIPFALMNPIASKMPPPGTKWRGNFYRIDYDVPTTYYSWKQTNGSFHDYQKFGTLIFE